MTSTPLCSTVVRILKHPHHVCARWKTQIYPPRLLHRRVCLPDISLLVRAPRVNRESCVVHKDSYHRYEIRSTLSYASRPLWATPPDGPHRILPHFYAENLYVGGDEICELHGWTSRSVIDSIEREMWDAVILDGPTDAELDLLEIRLNELAEVVDKVFIVESNRAYPSAYRNLYAPAASWPRV